MVSSFVLHDEIINRSNKKNLFDVVYYNREFVEHSKNILYKEYEKFSTQNVVVDSSSVIKKYNLEKHFKQTHCDKKVKWSDLRWYADLAAKVYKSKEKIQAAYENDFKIYVNEINEIRYIRRLFSWYCL